MNIHLCLVVLSPGSLWITLGRDRGDHDLLLGGSDSGCYFFNSDLSFSAATQITGLARRSECTEGPPTAAAANLCLYPQHFKPELHLTNGSHLERCRTSSFANLFGFAGITIKLSLPLPGERGLMRNAANSEKVKSEIQTLSRLFLTCYPFSRNNRVGKRWAQACLAPSTNVPTKSGEPRGFDLPKSEHQGGSGNLSLYLKCVRAFVDTRLFLRVCPAGGRARELRPFQAAL